MVRLEEFLASDFNRKSQVTQKPWAGLLLRGEKEG